MADTLNALFELFGALFVVLSIRKVYKDKVVRGISWLHCSFFAAWGYWNLYYYMAMNSPLSWWAGILLALTNTVYVVMLIYYTKRENPFKGVYRATF